MKDMGSMPSVLITGRHYAGYLSKGFNKFCQYGTPVRYVNWICSFLTSRKMQETVILVLSHWMDILSGVLQESKLGPFLLILYVNELPHWICDSIQMFTDATNIWELIYL